MPKPTRYIFVMGGVLSGLGKGIAVSSIARELQGLGYRVSAMKIDPYVNVDAGTMNPTEHGEVFVTKDGLETDQDIGNYERFLQVELTRDSYMTTGQVYLSVIRRERNLEYHGKTVRPVPDIPAEVIRRIKRAAQVTKAELMIIEIGGTVGEYENLLFLEAARMMHLQDSTAVQFILVSYLPIPSKLGEMKTKPTQHAVRALNAAGIHPDFVLCRGERSIDQPRRERISVFCNVHPDDVISAPDVDSVYQVPINFEREQLGQKILGKFFLKPRRRDLRDWRRLLQRVQRLRRSVRIGMVGKYFTTGEFTLSDSYLSVIESIKHASWQAGCTPNISWIDAESFERDRRLLRTLERFDGIIVPGGFGVRGVNGKIAAIEYVRRQRIPYFGLCYGLQLAVVEFARHVLKLSRAHTTEIDAKTPYPVIDMLPEQRAKLVARDFGGTMRLGEFRCRLRAGTRALDAYGRRDIRERHRHRYEVNNRYRTALERKGLRVAGFNPERDLVEIMELQNHPFFLGVQFHPEFKSYPLAPHPLFASFITAALHRQRRR
ncbi:MAG: CTP synthase [Candidatus Kerfeldbacteria bacterium]|nr:CTP synthase [Candidatus Kerfeldbacteria bacterium]